MLNHRIKEPVIVLSDSEADRANSGDEETRYSSTLDVIAFDYAVSSNTYIYRLQKFSNCASSS